MIPQNKNIKLNDITTGVEFETGRIIDGKKEYCKIITTTMPNNNSKYISTGITGGKLLYVKGQCMHPDGYGMPIPHITGGGTYIERQDVLSSIYVKTNADLSAYNGYFEIYYTKN